MTKPYTVLSNDLVTPLVLDSPHSGTYYPEDFVPACDKALLNHSTDLFVNELFEDATDLGVPLLQANIIRSYIDMNRAEDDLLPTLLEDEWHTDLHPSRYGKTGIGLIWDRASKDAPLYTGRIPNKEVIKRLETVYYPYYNALHQLIKQARKNHGFAWHLNLHSFPSTAFRMQKRIDFILGNMDGVTCCQELTETVKNFLKQCGYNVILNRQYKGGHIVKKTADPYKKIHSLQIEINRALYMDEAKQKKLNCFNKIKEDLHNMIEAILTESTKM